MNELLGFQFNVEHVLNRSERRGKSTGSIACMAEKAASVLYFNFNFILPKVNTDYIRQAQVYN